MFLVKTYLLGDIDHQYNRTCRTSRYHPTQHERRNAFHDSTYVVTQRFLPFKAS